LLKKKVGCSVVVTFDLPRMDDYEEVKVLPIEILDIKTIKKGNKADVMGLIKWYNLFHDVGGIRGIKHAIPGI
jgi:hypothetical protein